MRVVNTGRNAPETLRDWKKEHLFPKTTEEMRVKTKRRTSPIL
jgi:hypothetical protein